MFSTDKQKSPPFSLMAVGFKLFQEDEISRIKTFNLYYDQTEDNVSKAALYNDLAIAYFLYGDHKSAMTYFKEAERLDPDCANIQINYSIALFTLAKTESKNGNTYKSFYLNNEALIMLSKVEQTAISTLCRLGDVYKEHDQLSLARACYEKAVSYKPENNTDNVGYRKSMKALGRPEALKLYREAYQQSSENKEDHLEAHAGYQKLLLDEIHKRSAKKFALSKTPNPELSPKIFAKKPSSSPHTKYKRNDHTLEREFGTPKIFKGTKTSKQKTKQSTDQSIHLRPLF